MRLWQEGGTRLKPPAGSLRWLSCLAQIWPCPHTPFHKVSAGCLSEPMQGPVPATGCGKQGPCPSEMLGTEGALPPAHLILAVLANHLQRTLCDQGRLQHNLGEDPAEREGQGEAAENAWPQFL